MRKTIACLLALALMLNCVGVLPLQAAAATEGDYTYEVTDGSATITGYTDALSGEITIPTTLGGYPVIAIGKDAFARCNKLTSVTIPEGITSIGDGAFQYCGSLLTVSIPASVTSIGDSAFAWCTAMQGISVNEANTAYCSDDKGVLFDKNKTVLIQAPGKLAGSYTVADSVVTVGDYAFTYCDRLTDVTMGKNVKTIGYAAFYYCISLTSVTLSDSVTAIGQQAFGWCQRLKTLHMGAGVETIGDEAFYMCAALSSVDIPRSTTAIGGSAFACCDALTGIYVDENNAVYSSDDKGVLFDKNKTVLIQAPGGLAGSYEIPAGVVTVGDHAFENCMKVTAVTVPAGVETIGAYAFCFCERLATVTLSASVNSIGTRAFAYCNSLKTVYYGADSAAWKNIAIGSGNDALTAGMIHYGHIHDYSTVAPVTVPATCQKDGYVEYTCVMGETYRQVLPKVDHSYTGTETVVAPTCTEEGYTNVSCLWCDSVEKKDIVPALGHQLTTLPAVAPTCTETGLTEGAFCARCQTVITALTVVPALGHEAAAVPGVAPTCTETGLTEGSVCARCQTVLVEQEVIPVASHSYTDGVCTVCGAKEEETPTAAPGDVNGDGQVNSLDGLMLMRYLNGWSNVAISDAMDVNGDGQVNSLDGLILMRYLNGWEITLG